MSLGELLIVFANFLLALATVVMAVFTRRAVDATMEAARAAQAEAEASKDTVEEIRKDRDLNWRPHVVLGDRMTWAPGPDGRDTVEVQNIGRGPALNCIYARMQEDGGWRLSGGGGWHLREGESKAIGGVAAGEALPTYLIESAEVTAPSPGFVILYQDVLGNAYRSLQGWGMPEVRGPEGSPAWATWYLAQPGVSHP